jgi:hypothetical protein
MKRPFASLQRDQNSPGLLVCSGVIQNGCNDQMDPYRLPARQPEIIALTEARPDAPLDPEGDV